MESGTSFLQSRTPAICGVPLTLNGVDQVADPSSPVKAPFRPPHTARSCASNERGPPRPSLVLASSPVPPSCPLTPSNISPPFLVSSSSSYSSPCLPGRHLHQRRRRAHQHQPVQEHTAPLRGPPASDAGRAQGRVRGERRRDGGQSSCFFPTAGVHKTNTASRWSSKRPVRSEYRTNPRRNITSRFYGLQPLPLTIKYAVEQSRTPPMGKAPPRNETPCAVVPFKLYELTRCVGPPSRSMNFGAGGG